MLIKLFVIYCVLTTTFAWLAPERCAQSKSDQSKRARRTLTAATAKDAKVVRNIQDVTAEQHERLIETYKNHKFIGIPIKGVYDGNNIVITAPFNCTFHTYSPRLLSSVDCSVSACKLTHSVSTMDTYTASEGYNWGIKISAKASFGNIFEVGGEASTGGLYSCTYNRGTSMTDIVECSESTPKSGQLQLYSVNSDMVCDIGRITLVPDKRDNTQTKTSQWGYFTQSEIDEIEASAAIRFHRFDLIMIDTNKISDRLFEKIQKEFPHFNPYTDTVDTTQIGGGLTLYGSYVFIVKVNYFKTSTTDRQFRKIIPFTNEGGDSEFKYACIVTHK